MFPPISKRPTRAEALLALRFLYADIHALHGCRRPRLPRRWQTQLCDALRQARLLLEYFNA